MIEGPDSVLGWVVLALAAAGLALIVVYAAGAIMTYILGALVVLGLAYLLYAVLFRVDHRIRYGEWPSVGSGGEE